LDNSESHTDVDRISSDSSELLDSEDSSTVSDAQTIASDVIGPIFDDLTLSDEECQTIEEMEERLREILGPDDDELIWRLSTCFFIYLYLTECDD